MRLVADEEGEHGVTILGLWSAVNGGCLCLDPEGRLYQHRATVGHGIGEDDETDAVALAP